MNRQVAEKVGTLGNRRAWPLLYSGHCFYVRKCRPGVAHKGDCNAREIGGIVLPDQKSDFTCVVTVLGKGPRVGVKCSKGHAEKFRTRRCKSVRGEADKFLPRERRMGDDIKIGDKLLCPDGNHIGIQKTPWCNYEYIIEESVPLGIVDDDDGGNDG